MLNEEKVILMTKMASFEEHEGKVSQDVGNYFRGDYIAIQIMKSVVCATLSFLMVFALYIIYDFENFMQNIYKMDLAGFLQRSLLYYVIVLIAYAVLTYLLSTWKYYRANKSKRIFFQNLKKLSTFYREQ